MLLDRGEPAVEHRGRQPLVPHRVGRDDRLHQRVEPGAGETRNRHQRHAVKLRQRRGHPVAQLPQRRRLIGDRVPFVGGDDQRPPLFGDQIGDRQILPPERFERVEHRGRRSRRSGSCAACRRPIGARAGPRPGRGGATPRCRQAGSAGPAIAIRARSKSRVIPGSGPVSSRSSPTSRLTSVDLPTLGRPTIASCSGRSLLSGSADTSSGSGAKSRRRS
jgi:hypothetical protein